MRRIILILGMALVALGLTGLAVSFAYYYYAYPDLISQGSYSGDFGSPGMMMFRGRGYMDTELMRNMMTDFSKSDYSSNGEMIYLTSIDEDGNIIQPKSGPFSYNTRMMMMRPLACVSCHGIDAKGGFNFPDGKTESSDIRWKTLSKEDPDEREHEPFDEAAFKKAVRDGIEPNGDRLSYYMPQWDISDKDLDDLITYLKTF